jgi:hypothetical protein
MILCAMQLAALVHQEAAKPLASQQQQQQQQQQ